MAAPTILTSILTGGSSSHETSSEEVNAVATDFVSEGVVGTITNTSGVAPATGAFAVNAQGTPDTTIQISTGVAYVTATPTSQNSQALRIKCTVAGSLTISANSSGSTKYDWIYISVSATNAANPNSGADNVATIVASRSSSASSDDGTPPTYGYPIAVVTVANGFSTITNGNIRDVRTNCIVNLGSSSVTSGWTDLGYTPNTVTHNGNRSYDLVFNSVDLTSTLSNGMRLKATRLVAAPTRCTDLESGSSQYYSKTSPAGTTFTDDFVVSAWIKLESLTGTHQAIISRYNGTSGWVFRITDTGQVHLLGYNASSANNSGVTSVQSIPLGRWVHVVAQLDMSAFTATTTTSYIMIDGVDVPATVARAGTNPTALVQAGNLEVGGTNGGTLPFDGKLAQVAYFNAKVTQATVKTYISQTLSGSETSLVSAYSFDNSINDLSANANNLTANNSAVATNADSPFTQNDAGTPTGTTDYAIVTARAFSTNTTLTVQVPEGSTIPTSGGVSAVSYSVQKVPFGFPLDSRKWTVEYNYTDDNTGLSSTSYAQVGTHQTTVPIGAWRLEMYAMAGPELSGNNTNTFFLALSTATSSASDATMVAELRGPAVTSLTGFHQTAVYIKGFANITSATVYYQIYKRVTLNGRVVGSSATNYIKAICDYL